MNNKTDKRPTIMKEQECKLTLKTPFAEYQTCQYLTLIKMGNECCIECNGLNFQDILEFREQLDYIIKGYGHEIEVGGCNN